MKQIRRPAMAHRIVVSSLLGVFSLMLAVVGLTFAAPGSLAPLAQATPTGTVQATTTLTATVTVTPTGTPTTTLEMWQPLPLAMAPDERCAHTLIWDATNQRVILYGGRSDTGDDLDDVWELTATGWAPLTPAAQGPQPPGRYDHSAIYDAANHRMIIFGGVTSTGAVEGFLNDIWALDLTRGAERWTQLEAGTGGPSPQRRGGHSAVYEPSSQRMIIFGGRGGQTSATTPIPTPAVTGTPEATATAISGPGPVGFFQDMWAYNLGSEAGGWAQLVAATTSPDRRADHAAVYDPVNRRMVLYGGRRLNEGLNVDVVNDDTWSVSLAALIASPITGTVPVSWTILTPTTTPNGRAAMAYTYDSPRQRLLFFGGRVGGAPGQPGMSASDTWAFDLTAGGGEWTNLVPTGPRPSTRHESAMVYVPTLNGSILFGGCNDAEQPDQETWLLGPVTQMTVTPQPTGSVTPGTGTPTATGSATPIMTGTTTPVATGSATAIATTTGTATAMMTGTTTPVATGSATAMATTTGTATPMMTGTPTPIATGSATAMATTTGTATPMMTGTPTPIATGSATAMATTTGTVTPMMTGTTTPAATGTATMMATTTGTATVMMTGTTTPAATGSATPMMTGTTTPVATGSVTPGTGTPTGTVTPGTSTPVATATTPAGTSTPTTPGFAGIVVVRAFIDFGCDTFFNRGYDYPLAGTSVTITLPDGTTRVAVVDENGNAVLTNVNLNTAQSVTVTGDTAPPLPTWVQQGGFTLVPCAGSPVSRLTRANFGVFGVAYVDLRYTLAGGGQ